MRSYVVLEEGSTALETLVSPDFGSTRIEDHFVFNRPASSRGVCTMVNRCHPSYKYPKLVVLSVRFADCALP